MASKRSKERSAGRAAFWPAIERILSHAESHGEAYPGAISDHATVRSVMADASDVDPGADPGGGEDTPDGPDGGGAPPVGHGG